MWALRRFGGRFPHSYADSASQATGTAVSPGKHMYIWVGAPTPSLWLEHHLHVNSFPNPRKPSAALTTTVPASQPILAQYLIYIQTKPLPEAMNRCWTALEHCSCRHKVQHVLPGKSGHLLHREPKQKTMFNNHNINPHLCACAVVPSIGKHQVQNRGRLECAEINMPTPDLSKNDPAKQNPD